MVSTYTAHVRAGGLSARHHLTRRADLKYDDIGANTVLFHCHGLFLEAGGAEALVGF